ncbi:hypothetical protein TanjilG_24133 [Lupinus angustifolius]|uniref:Uncharacterized protein n=1 Tax=Lupinus angustifolius TaxID=3871 RepID=A0A1J7HQE5_LUPAN|nr:hypothetical protein TanjilG_24133 [Lupinus angustifolius]
MMRRKKIRADIVDIFFVHLLLDDDDEDEEDDCGFVVTVGLAMEGNVGEAGSGVSPSDL